MPFILQTNRLSKKIGSKMLVTDVDIHIRKGEIYGFLGPNGAGKNYGNENDYKPLETCQRYD